VTAAGGPGRAVVVTGAASGIGLACARRLAASGWLVFAGVRDPGAEALRALGPHAVPVRLDLQDGATIRAAADRVAAELSSRGIPGLAGLTNNAGVAVAGPLEFLPVDAFREQLEVNLTAQLAVTQAFLPLLRRAEPPGRIVFMGSVSGLVALPLLGPYAASKFALEALADALRMELAPWGLRVALVEPGSVRTPIWRKGAERARRIQDAYPPEAAERYGPELLAVERHALRLGERGIAPETVARAVVHALTAPRPRTRYLVAPPGRAWTTRLLRRLPDRLRDRLLTQALRQVRGQPATRPAPPAPSGSRRP
jgi:NAD(P)-dependent dehydrogenase (short-subunit alcohol dehydrogenase family)